MEEIASGDDVTKDKLGSDDGERQRLLVLNFPMWFIS